MGNAVTRNRIRRRLREILRVIALPVGDYLIGVSPSAADRSFDDLRTQVNRLISTIESGQVAS